MPIRFLPGRDIFQSDAQALVNPVNCVGVMGKGLALRFKNRLPEASRSYVRACAAGKVMPGVPYVCAAFVDGLRRYVIHAPTKKHWRDPSQLPWIEDICQGIRSFLLERKIASVAIPMIGCGEGGLSWDDVCPIITHWLGDLETVEVTVYGENVSSSFV